MDSNNKIIQLQKDNIYSTTHSSSMSSSGGGGSSGGGNIVGCGKGFDYGGGGSGLTSSSVSTLTGGFQSSASSSSVTPTTIGTSKPDRRSVYRPEQGLEELRNLQEQLRCEKSDWIKRLNEEKSSIEAEKSSLEELKESVRREQKDVEEQRETLYRKLEALQKEGIILSPAHTIVNTSNPNNRGSNCFHNSGVSSSSGSVHGCTSSSSGSSAIIVDQSDDRLTGLTSSQLTRSVGLNNISSTPSSSSSSPPSSSSSSSSSPSVITTTGSITSDKFINQSSTSIQPLNYAFNNNVGASNNIIKQQLPLKLAVNEPGQGRCNHSQSVNSPNNQQLPPTIGNIPVSKVFLAQF